MGRRPAFLLLLGALAVAAACSDKANRAPLVNGGSSGGGGTSSSGASDASISLDGGQVISLSDEQLAPSSLVLTGSHVLWIDKGNATTLGSVQRAALPSGAPEILAKNVPGPTSIAVDATGTVFVSVIGQDATLPGIYRLQGSTLVAVSTGVEDEAPSSLVADKNDLFWLSTSAGGVSLRRKPTASAAVTIAQSVVGTYGEHAIVVSGGQVFAALDAGGSGTILRAAANSTGGAGEVVGNVVGGIGQIVLGPDSASLLGTTPGGIVRVDLASGKATALVSGLGTPTVLARDGNNLFFFDAKAGTVARVSTAGGTPDRILEGFTTVTSMAVNGTGAFLTPTKSVVFVRF